MSRTIRQRSYISIIIAIGIVFNTTIADLVFASRQYTFYYKTVLSVPNGFNPPCVIVNDNGSLKVDLGSSRTGLLERAPKVFFLYLIAAAYGNGYTEEDIVNLIEELFGDDPVLSSYSWKDLQYIGDELVLKETYGSNRTRYLVFTGDEPGDHSKRSLRFAGKNGKNRGKVWLREKTEVERYTEKDRVNTPVDSDDISGIALRDPSKAREIITLIASDYNSCGYALKGLSRGAFANIFLSERSNLLSKKGETDEEILALRSFDKALAGFLAKDREEHGCAIASNILDMSAMPLESVINSAPRSFAELMVPVYEEGHLPEDIRKDLKKVYDKRIATIRNDPDKQEVMHRLSWVMRVERLLINDTAGSTFFKPARSKIVLEIDARALFGKYSKTVDPAKFDKLPIDKNKVLEKLVTPDNNGFTYIDDNGYVTEKFQGFTKEFVADMMGLVQDTKTIRMISEILAEARGGLKNVPDEIWDWVAAQGIGTVWIKAVWQKSPMSMVGMKRCQEMYGEVNLKRLASGYDVYDYVLDPVVGSSDDFKSVAAKLKARGVTIGLDYVSNHIAKDSPLVWRVPGLVVTYDSFEELQEAAKRYFGTDDIEALSRDFVPIYSSMESLSGDPANRDKWVSAARYDSFHLNQLANIKYWDERARKYMIDIVLDKIADLTLNGAVRADVAYTVLKDTVYWNWAAPLGWSREYFDEEYPREFWAEFAESAAERYPGMVIYAESYEFGDTQSHPWDGRARVMQSEGIVTYEKHLSDLLKAGDVKTIRAYLLQEGSLAFWNNTAAFTENHDEESMLEAPGLDPFGQPGGGFGSLERAMAATAISGTKMGHMIMTLRQLIGMKMPEGAWTRDSKSGDSAIYEFYYPDFERGKGFRTLSGILDLVRFMSKKVIREGDMYSAALKEIYKAKDPDSAKKEFFKGDKDKKNWDGCEIEDSSIVPYIRRTLTDSAVCLTNYSDHAEAAVIDLDGIYDYYEYGPEKLEGILIDRLVSEGVKYELEGRTLYVQLPAWGYGLFHFLSIPEEEGINLKPDEIKNEKPKSVIFFANDIVDNLGVFDIKDTFGDRDFQDLFVDSNGIYPGSVVLYGSIEKCTLIKKRIEEVSDIEVYVVEKRDKGLSEEEEIKEIVNISKQVLSKDTSVMYEFVGILKGDTKNPLGLQALCQDKGVEMPIVVFNDPTGKGIFSIKIALQKMLDAKYNKAGSEWFCLLDPVDILTDDLRMRLIERLAFETRA